MLLRGGDATERVTRTADDLDDDCCVVGEGEEEVADQTNPSSESSESTSSGFVMPGADRPPGAPPETIQDLLRECERPVSEHTTRSEDSTWPTAEVCP